MLSTFILLAAAQAPAGKPVPPPIVVEPVPAAPVMVQPPRPVMVQPPAPPRRVEPARARADLNSYLAASDYPPEALFNQESGIVGVLLFVDADGRVAQCVVNRASASPSLDEATCPILRARARFTPARDSYGNPTSDRVPSAVVWRLPGAPPPPRARPVRPLQSLLEPEDFPERAPRGGPFHGTTTFELAVGPDGGVTACTLRERSRSPALDEAACTLMRERALFTPARDAAGRAVADRHRGHLHWDMPPMMIMTANVTPPPIVTPTAPPAPPRMGPTPGFEPAPIVANAVPRRPLQSFASDDDYPASALSRGEEGRPVFRLTVGPDGRVANCLIVVSSGSSALDNVTCRLMRSRARFTPARDANGNPAADTYLGELVWRIPG